MAIAVDIAAAAIASTIVSAAVVAGGGVDVVIVISDAVLQCNSDTSDEVPLV